MKSLLHLGVALAGVAIGIAVGPSLATAADAPAVGKVYELRTYTTHPGRLDALHARFANHTCKLFKKHGIEVVGFWTPAEGDEAQNTLVYLVVFPSVEAQKKAWAAFKVDPEWVKAKAASEQDGPINMKVETKNLLPTPYSPLR